MGGGEHLEFSASGGNDNSVIVFIQNQIIDSGLHGNQETWGLCRKMALKEKISHDLKEVKKTQRAE